jgi:hypothetical protein
LRSKPHSYASKYAFYHNLYDQAKNGRKEVIYQKRMLGLLSKEVCLVFSAMNELLLICLANEIVRRHNNSVYDGVAIRNVARQIDELYWQSTNPEDPLYGEDEDEPLRVGDDLTRVE